MSKIKLIGFDLDGTILEPGQLIPQNTQEVLTKASLQEVKVAIVSGRPLPQQYNILEINGLGPTRGWPHYLITNESQIYVLDKNGYEPVEEWNEKIHEEWMKVLPRARTIILEELERLTREGLKVRRHLTDEEAVIRNMIDLLFENVDDARAFEPDLSGRLPRKSEELWCNRNYCLIQILHRLAGKGNTVSVLANYAGIKPEEVLVVGDSGNDLSMLDGKHGFKVATVSNADPAVKESVSKQGGYVASAPVSKGIIEIVEKLIFDE